jgi:GH24 family phage-related lysozyme (muramidase)
MMAETKPKGDPIEIPLGITAVLPGEDLEGTLIPEVALVFDQVPEAVSHVLATPSALSVKWPIAGKAPNLHDLTLPAQLTWLVERPEEQPSSHTAEATGAKTVVKIDGSGRFQVLVDNNPPVLEFIAARIVGSGKVRFSVSLREPPGAKTQELKDPVRFNLQCKVSVTTVPPSGLRLGDQAKYSIQVRDELAKTELALCAVEQDAKDSGGGTDALAWRHVLPSRTSSDCSWTIGFSDGSGWWNSHFSYSENVEEGNFEYGWELRAKSPLLPVDHEPFTILTSKAPLLVQKPKLAEFRVAAVDYNKGTWRAAGKIEGFSPSCPRVRVALRLVDRAGQRYPASDNDVPQVVLDKDGKFEKEIVGPKVAAPGAGEAPPMEVFAILSLVPTWKPDGKVNPISGFLGYNEETFALCDDAGKPGWDPSSGWICSEKATDITPRPAAPKKGVLQIPAPGPGALDAQTSELTIDEIMTDLVAWEGEVPHLYLDSKGLMTIGIGTCLVTSEKARDSSRTLQLPFLNLDNDKKPAEKEEIRAAFNKVMVMPAKMGPSNYLTHPRLELTAEYIRDMVRDFVNNKAIPALKRNFPNYDHFPKCARRALIDILYNCGPGFLNDSTPKAAAKAPKMRAALLAQDWKKVSSEVPTAGRAERRKWRMDLLDFAQTWKDAQKAPQS